MRAHPLAFVIALAALGGSVVPGAVQAQKSVVFYQCTDASGAVTVQNDRPCPPGTTEQDRRVIQPAPTAPLPGTAAPAATPPRLPVTTAIPSEGVIPAAAGTILNPPLNPGTVAPVDSNVLAAAPPLSVTDRRPPPALFECGAAGGTRYLSEVANPAPRCAAAETTGFGSTAAPAGGACEVVIETCEPVAAPLLCERWGQRLRVMETARTFGRLDESETASVEIDRVRAIVTESTCGA